MNSKPERRLTRRDFLKVVSAATLGLGLTSRGLIVIGQGFRQGGAISDHITYHYTPERTGWFTGPGISVPPVEGWRKQKEINLGSAVRGAPLLLSRWQIQGQDLPHAGETHALLFVATSGNRIDAYAIDQLHATSPTPIWSQQLPPALHRTDSNIPPPIGISSTPVLDPQNRRMFVVASQDDGSGNGVYFIYSLSLDSGKILQQAKLQDLGAAGRPTFDGTQQDQRGALNLVAGRVYATFAGLLANDLGSYRGWIVGCNADNLSDQWFSPVTVSPNLLGGVWGPGGVAAAPDNSLYVATGNGTRGSDDPAGDSAYWATLFNGALALEGNKVALPGTTVGAPALVSMNDARLAVAWTDGGPGHHLQVATSTDGRSFGTVVTLPESSIDGPGFAFGTSDAFPNGLIFLAWSDPQQRLNVMASPDGQTFGDKITLDATSPVGSALAFGNGRWYLAWVAADSYLLNILSWTDIARLSDLSNVTLDESTGAAPGLSFINGTLYLLWRGTDENRTLHIMQSPDGVNFTNKIELGESSDFRPVLTQQGTLFYLAWIRRDPQHQLNLEIGGDVSSLGHKQTFSEASGAGPMLANVAGQIYIGWTSADNPAQINISTGRHPADVGDYFQCVLRLGTSGGLQVLDWYSPVDTPYQNFQDWDLGGSSVLVLPPINGRELLVLTGKDGSVYLLDRFNLGHWGGELRRISVFDNSSVKLSKCAPAYFQSRAGGHHVYVASESFPGLVAYKVVVSDDGKTVDLNEAWVATVLGANTSKGITPGVGMGSPIVMSTPGTNHEAVIWIVDNVELADGSQGIAVLRAFDALSGMEVFNSSQPSKDNMNNVLGPAPHFPPITCGSAGVFVGTKAGFVWYGP